jgi:hypothetical protein
VNGCGDITILKKHDCGSKLFLAIIKIEMLIYPPFWKEVKKKMQIYLISVNKKSR